MRAREVIEVAGVDEAVGDEGGGGVRCGVLGVRAGVDEAVGEEGGGEGGEHAP